MVLNLIDISYLFIDQMYLKYLSRKPSEETQGPVQRRDLQRHAEVSVSGQEGVLGQIPA